VRWFDSGRGHFLAPLESSLFAGLPGRQLLDALSALIGSRPLLAVAAARDVQRRDIQRLADDFLAEGRDPSTIRNALMPLRVIYRRALEDGDVALNPCTNLRLPAVRRRRERIASPDEAQQLLAALPERDRSIWATALFAGLRRGELMALRWEDIDLAAGLIRIERSYDDKGRVEIEPKSRAGQHGSRLYPDDV
jgi:integrase